MNKICKYSSIFQRTGQSCYYIDIYYGSYNNHYVKYNIYSKEQ